MVALEIRDMQLHVERPPTRSFTGMTGMVEHQVVTGPAKISVDFRSELISGDRDGLKDLLELGADQLEIVLRRRSVRPQDIQSAVKPPPPWETAPASKIKKAAKTDAPETQPEPEEPTTAQLVEEFGSWG